jgi:hypothetical protein
VHILHNMRTSNMHPLSFFLHSDTNSTEELWSEQGLASTPLHREDKQDGSIIMLKDPITNLPMLSNLSGAPGMIHWFDPLSNSVVGVLEVRICSVCVFVSTNFPTLLNSYVVDNLLKVSPYNRVSRRDCNKDSHIPVPSVTNMAIGKNGKDLVTTDIVFTENLSVGSPCSIDAPNNAVVPMSVCTSIKFWIYKGSSSGKSDQHSRQQRSRDTLMNYELVSSMASPHGKDGSVCGLDVAPSGNVACTLSQQENAFRVWAKNTATDEVLWKCLYKVKSPSGFSNMLSKKTEAHCERLVSFSNDGSVLSVCFGPVVTLWDHSTATLLTSLDTELKEDIQEVHFMNKTDDTLLLRSKSGVCMKSPFGGSCSRRYLGNDEWEFHAGLVGDERGTISAVIPLPEFSRSKGSGGFFVVCVAGGNQSIVSIVNREKGELFGINDDKTPTQWKINSQVQALCMNACRGSSLQVLAITNDCNLLSLNIEAEKGQDVSATGKKKAAESNPSLSAPMLKITAENNEPPTKRRKITLAMNKKPEKSNYAGFDFPALSCKFTKAFIAGRLHR